MEKLLEKYLRKLFDNEEIVIGFHSIDGAICNVEYYYNDFRIYKDSTNINIWDMLIFVSDNLCKSA